MNGTRKVRLFPSTSGPARSSLTQETQTPGRRPVGYDPLTGVVSGAPTTGTPFPLPYEGYSFNINKYLNVLKVLRRTSNVNR